MNRWTRFLFGAIAALALLSASTADAGAESASHEVERVIAGFHSALLAGEPAKALGHLADDAIILESGGIETKEHYGSGHLPGDIRFAQAVPRKQGELQVQVVGDTAWAYSTSTVQGRMGDREINSQSAELVVLVRVDGTWKIKAIHWSSRKRS